MKVKHADVGVSLLRDAVTVTAFGPKTKEALATRKICPISQTVHLVPTPFLITCDEIWRKHFGRRYSVNLARRSDYGKVKEQKPGTGTKIGIARAAAASRRALAKPPSEPLSQGTLVPNLTLASLAGQGSESSRTPRQEQIWDYAVTKFQKARQDGFCIGRGTVVSAAPPADATAKAKAKAKAKATAVVASPETKFYWFRLGFGGERPILAAGGTWVSDPEDAHVIVVHDLAVVQDERDCAGKCLDLPFHHAFLVGLRVVTAAYLNASAPGAGTSNAFEPALRKKFVVFFTERFKTKHAQSVARFCKAARNLG